MELWLKGETEVSLLEENLPQCRFINHKTHKPARMRTRAAAVRNQRLTAWAKTRPYYTVCNICAVVLRTYWEFCYQQFHVKLWQTNLSPGRSLFEFSSIYPLLLQ
jgi:hypothetical protein